MNMKTIFKDHNIIFPQQADSLRNWVSPLHTSKASRPIKICMPNHDRNSQGQDYTHFKGDIVANIYSTSMQKQY